MKKVNLLGLHSPIFKGFLISSMGLIFLALNLFMVLSFKHIAANMRAEEVRVMKNKLYTIAEDMENQTDSMANIVIRIAYERIFYLGYIQENKYHEVEAVEQLQRYSDFSQIVRSYFVKYESCDRLFTSAGTTISPELYFAQKQGLEDYESIMELLDRLCIEQHNGFFLYREGEMTLFLYPLQVYAQGNTGRAGVVGFLVPSEEIEKRIERIAGDIYGDMDIFYEDFCIMGSGEVRGENAVSAEMTHFQVYVQADRDYYFSWKNVFSFKEVMALLSIIFLLACLTLMAAWWNYRPFQKAVAKYDAIQGRYLMDWNDVDKLIEFLLHEKETNSKLVDRQYRMLQEQAVHLIVTGGYSQQLQKRLTLLNINLDFPVFTIIRNSFPVGQITEECREKMACNIRELSGRGYALYSYWENDQILQVLAAMEEEYEIAEVVELLQSLFDTMELNVKVEPGTVYYDLKEIHGAAQDMDGKKELLQQQEKAAERKREERTGTAKRNSMEQIIRYIGEHCTDYNLSLDMIAREAKITPQHLCVKLKQEIGMSYKEYLTKLRIEAAKALLTEEEISVNDVCQRVGYINVSYFIRIFQKHTGVTPTKYRAECRDREENSKA